LNVWRLLWAEFGAVDGSWGWATHRKAESHGLTFMRAALGMDGELAIIPTMGFV
jgi:hypothetical protein